MSSGLCRKAPGCPRLRLCRLGAAELFRASTRKEADWRRAARWAASRVFCNSAILFTTSSSRPMRLASRHGAVLAAQFLAPLSFRPHLRAGPHTIFEIRSAVGQPLTYDILNVRKRGCASAKIEFEGAPYHLMTPGTGAKQYSRETWGQVRC